jgi:hypothetical protein
MEKKITHQKRKSNNIGKSHNIVQMIKDIQNMEDIDNIENKKRMHIALVDRKSRKNNKDAFKVNLITNFKYDTEDTSKNKIFVVKKQSKSKIEDGIKVDYDITFEIFHGHLKIKCNCKSKFNGFEKSCSSNCKHVSFILFKIMHNYFKTIIPYHSTSFNTIIKYFKNKELINIDLTDNNFRARFIQAYKKISENMDSSKSNPDAPAEPDASAEPDRSAEPEPDEQLSPDQDDKSKIFHFPLENENNITFHYSEHNTYAVCNCCPTGMLMTNCIHIEAMIINLIRSYIFSFRYTKIKPKNMTDKNIRKLEKQQEEEAKFIEIFENLKI